MIEGLGTFALGVAAALVARAVGPSLGRRSRPLVRETIKQAMILGDGVRARTEGLQEDLADLAAEARSEVRQQQQQGQGQGQGAPAGSAAGAR
jgi:Protein of unknown function (DUF5132)